MSNTKIYKERNGFTFLKNDTVILLDVPCSGNVHKWAGEWCTELQLTEDKLKALANFCISSLKAIKRAS